MKILINHSNHPSSKWEETQLHGWDKIIDLYFPNVEPELDTNDKKFKKLIIDNLDKILQIQRENPEYSIFIMLQGEFSYCFLLFQRLKEYGFNIAIPTTKRLVTENPDGSKTSKFQFVRWRIL